MFVDLQVLRNSVAFALGGAIRCGFKKLERRNRCDHSQIAMVCRSERSRCGGFSSFLNLKREFDSFCLVRFVCGVLGSQFSRDILRHLEAGDTCGECLHVYEDGSANWLH